jgi:mRNA interferase RelE/StbE
MAKYTILFSKKVDKFLEKHPELVDRFFVCVEKLIDNPYSATLDVKPLQWVKHHWRLRIGKRRFLYEINDITILIYMYDADSRWDIYTQKK